MGILSPETEALIIRQASLRGETPDALVRRLLETEAPPPPGPPTIGAPRKGARGGRDAAGAGGHLAPLRLGLHGLRDRCRHAATPGAAAAYARFGKGIAPRARLNLGDCVSCALAKTPDAPLLFKGTDFAATDIVPALPPAGP